MLSIGGGCIYSGTGLAWASKGMALVWIGITGNGGLFCMSPGKMKSKGEMDLLALMPLQPVANAAISAKASARPVAGGGGRVTGDM